MKSIALFLLDGLTRLFFYPMYWLSLLVDLLSRASDSLRSKWGLPRLGKKRRGK